MACSNPFTMRHLWKNMHSHNVYGFKDYVVPCGWCLNCRRDKQNYYCDLAKETYDYNNIARPRVRMSKGFGKGLLTENIPDIVQNNYSYPIARGLRRPISSYWKKIVTDGFRPSLTRDTSAFNFDRKVSEFKRYHPNSSLTHYDLKLTHRKELDSFMLDLARRRESRIKQQLLDRGTPVFSHDIFYRDKFGSFHYNSDYVHKLSDSALRVLSDSYINKLLEVS